MWTIFPPLNIQVPPSTPEHCAPPLQVQTAMSSGDGAPAASLSDATEDEDIDSMRYNGYTLRGKVKIVSRGHCTRLSFRGKSGTS